MFVKVKWGGEKKEELRSREGPGALGKGDLKSLLLKKSETFQLEVRNQTCNREMWDEKKKLALQAKM